MKKILYIFLVLILSVSMHAQVDRSVQPKPAAAPNINLGKPQSFVLPNGLTVLVVENHKLPRVTFSLTLDNPPSVEGGLKGVDNLTSSLMGNGTSKISKDDFNNKIDYYGALLHFSVHNVGGSALSRYFPEILSLAAQACLDPAFTQEDFSSEQNKLVDGLKTQEKNAQHIAGQVRRALIYGTQHPKGEVISENSVRKVTLSDVNYYYKSYFVPENAYLVIVGDIKFNTVKKIVTENFESWGKANAPVSAYKEPTNTPKSEINLVDLSNAVQSEVYVSNVISLKMTDPDYFAALLANQILGGGGEGRLFLNLRETHAWTYGSYSRIQADKYVTDFSAQASVRNAVTDSAIVEIRNEINKIRTTLPTQGELDLAKAKYIGGFVMNAEQPETIAGFALAEKTRQLPNDFYANYIKNVNAVTLQQVQDAAKKYISFDNMRIVVVGKASEILPGLESLNIPIKYYDKLGIETSKPETKEVDANVSVQSVLQKYIDAIGGDAAIKSVKTLSYVMTAKMQGQEISINQKQTSEGKYSQTTYAMGMELSKIVYDGTKGSVTIQGKKDDITAEQLSYINTQIVPELSFMSSPDVKLAGVEKINDADAYKIVKGSKTMFYDLSSGLKVAEDSSKEVNGRNISQRSTFSDYKDVKGIKIPYAMTANMMGTEIEFSTSDIKINEGVADSDFN